MLVFAEPLGPEVVQALRCVQIVVGTGPIGFSPLLRHAFKRPATSPCHAHAEPETGGGRRALQPQLGIHEKGRDLRGGPRNR